MARDYTRIVSDIQNARDVFVTADGELEDAEEARRNETQEDRVDKPAVQRTRLKPDIFGADAIEFRVSSRVVDSFHEEAARFRVETGGIVVGTDASTVTELIPSGPKAHRSSASWELDTEHLQPLLERAEDRGLRFLGIWHVHPDGVAELSGTDVRTARRILCDNDYAISRLLLPLSVRGGRGLETRFFLATGTRADITTPRIALVASGSRDRPGDAKEGPWGRSGHFLHTVYGRERVTRDQVELADAGWRVQHLRELEDFHALSISRKGLEFVLLLPREYPFAPPDVIEVFADGATRQIPHSDLPETTPWSSLRSLATVAEDAARAIQGSDDSSGIRHRPSWLRSLISIGRRRSIKALEG